MEEGEACVMKGLEAVTAEENCWLQNMKWKVFIACLNKKESNSMRAQQTAEATFREVYSKRKICVWCLSLIALLRIIFIIFFLLFLLCSIFPGGEASLPERGRLEMTFFNSPSSASFSSISTFLLEYLSVFLLSLSLSYMD